MNWSKVQFAYDSLGYRASFAPTQFHQRMVADFLHIEYMARNGWTPREACSLSAISPSALFTAFDNWHN